MAPHARRIGAIVLPDIECELACKGHYIPSVALGVVAAPEQMGDSEQEREALLGKVLSSVSEGARRFGVRAGQTVAEARALVANLVVRGVTTDDLRRALGRVAEIGLAFGPTVSISSETKPSLRSTLCGSISPGRPI